MKIRFFLANPFGCIIHLLGYIRAWYVSLIYPRVKFRYLHIFAHINSFEQIAVGHDSVMLANSKIILLGASKLSIGKNALISNCSGITIVNAEIKIGNNFSLNESSFVEAIESSTILGDDIRCGKNVHIGAANHKWKLFFRKKNQYLSFDDTPLHKTSTILGNNLWICSSAIVVAGSTVESNSVLMPFSKVTIND